MIKKWEKPIIKHGEMTNYNYIVQYPENLNLGKNFDIGEFTYINSKFGVEINDEVEDFADFAKLHGINYKILKYFNPWLRQNYLKNRKKKTYKIIIPDPPFNMTHEAIILKNNGIVTID